MGPKKSNQKQTPNKIGQTKSRFSKSPIYEQSSSSIRNNIRPYLSPQHSLYAYSRLQNNQQVRSSDNSILQQESSDVFRLNVNSNIIEPPQGVNSDIQRPPLLSDMPRDYYALLPVESTIRENKSPRHNMDKTTKSKFDNRSIFSKRSKKVEGGCKEEKLEKKKREDKQGDDDKATFGFRSNNRTSFINSGSSSQPYLKKLETTSSQRGGYKAYKNEGEVESELAENGQDSMVSLQDEIKNSRAQQKQIQLKPNINETALNVTTLAAVQPLPQPIATNSKAAAARQKPKNPYRGRHNSYPELQFILSETIKRIIAKHFKIKQRQIRELASNIFEYLQKQEVYSQEEKFKNSKGWLDKYLRRNRDVDAMVYSARQEAEVKPWMLNYIKLWEFLTEKVTNPDNFHELPLLTQQRLRKEKEDVAVKREKKKEFKRFVGVRSNSKEVMSDGQSKLVWNQREFVAFGSQGRVETEQYLDQQLSKARQENKAMQEEDNEESEESYESEESFDEIEEESCEESQQMSDQESSQQLPSKRHTPKRLPKQPFKRELSPDEIYDSESPQPPSNPLPARCSTRSTPFRH